ncbi:MAG TPA: ribosome biogenesis GTP-binding protein YihA/YsxC [Usitatibacter sp.]|jgi:GTP-binding protein|nr:ribosome biogenesis GTP-binding protein YihA/YsxC [Usitatibacter sp.]
MSPAKAVKTRIREPRRRKDSDSSVARGAPARRGAPGLALAQAAYALSVHDPRELPAPGIPELAFAGRSNAGKSSAINALAGRRRLAFTSKTPGRTQLINFFSLGKTAYLVDLPGYGYAGVPDEVREHWEVLVGGYIANRESLAGVVVVMDARHPLTALDRQLLEWLGSAGRRVHVLLTKADKLSRQAATATLERVRRELPLACPGSTVQLFSSLKNQGIDEAAGALARLAATKNKAPAKGE